MGRMIEGRWHSGEATAGNEGGAFKREDSGFRRWITPRGDPGPDGQDAVPAAAGRYHLYVSHACPWAHRTMIVRALKGLDSLVDVSVVDPLMREDGWTLKGQDGGSGDRIGDRRFLHQVYAAARPDYTGKVTVPVLWDREQNAIVNNESSEVIRIFNQAFDDLGAAPGDFYPPALRTDIDAVNDRVYRTLNNGVYRCGFATSQDTYDEAVGPLFETLDWLEDRLAGSDWLVGDQMTEADIRLFTTLIRFDPVYHIHFKCSVKRIADYPALSRFVARMMGDDRIAATVHFDHIKAHYYRSHVDLNPSGIVPADPVPLVPGTSG